VINDEPDAYRAGGGIIWSADSAALGIEMYAIDHKDRWLASVDLANFALVPQPPMSDAAWIEGAFNKFGWLNDSRTLWYASESPVMRTVHQGAEWCAARSDFRPIRSVESAAIRGRPLVLRAQQPVAPIHTTSTASRAAAGLYSV